jgi:hypothetical protein
MAPHNSFEVSGEEHLVCLIGIYIYMYVLDEGIGQVCV